MRGGKSTCNPPDANNKTGKAQEQQEEGPSPTTKTQKDHEVEEEMVPKDFIDTSYLSFPKRKRKKVMDEQFAHFVEMIEKTERPLNGCLACTFLCKVHQGYHQ
jgi:hypothetical protein